MKSSKYSRNIWIIYLFNFFHGMMFFMPIYSLYLQQELFTAMNVAIIISVLTLSKMLLEVPSGAISDLFGRRNTLICAAFIAIIALIFLSIGGSMLMFIMYAIIMALSGSLISGTDTAILFDSLKASRKETNFQKIITFNVGSWQSGAALGSLIGGVLASISLRTPVIITFIPFILALMMTFFIIEPPYKKEVHKNIFLHMKNTSKLLVKNGLLMLFIATVLLFALSEVSYTFNPLLLDFKHVPIIYLGVVFALGFALGFLSSFVSSHYLNKRFGDKKILMLSIIATALSTVIATFVNGLWTAMFLVLSSIFFSIRLPIIMDWYNKKTPSKNRATMMSVVSFGSLLGMTLYAPIFGRMVDVYNVSLATRWTAMFTVAAILLILFVKE